MDFTITKVDDEYLAHSGIKGQKWGVRRFQNEDRTWTEAGKIRYGDNKSSSKKNSVGSIFKRKKSVPKTVVIKKDPEKKEKAKLQNEDGTLTEEGRRRLYTTGSPTNSTKRGYTKAALTGSAAVALDTASNIGYNKLKDDLDSTYSYNKKALKAGEKEAIASLGKDLSSDEYNKSKNRIKEEYKDKREDLKEDYERESKSLWKYDSSKAVKRSEDEINELAARERLRQKKEIKTEDLSNAELKAITERLTLERNYRNIVSEETATIDAGEKKAKNVLGTIAGLGAATLTTLQIVKLIKELKE